MLNRHSRPRSFVLLLACGVLLATAAALAAAAVPVGYDHPESDRGGPTLATGFARMDEVCPRRLTFATKLPGGPLSVVAFLNMGGQVNAYELGRRLPVDLLSVIPAGGFTHEYKSPACFDAVRALFASGKRIDVFVFCRVALNTVPVELQYQILRRVKEEGAGIVELDQFEGTFAGNYLAGVTPFAQGPQLIPGIPYEGLRQAVNGRTEFFPGLHGVRTGGFLHSEPAPQPFAYASIAARRLGPGIVLSYYTNSGFSRGYGASALVPDIQETRDMWVERDYLYSHSAKALLLASGRPQAAQITGMQPRGSVEPTATAELSLVAPGGAFTGTVRWQLRDTWGLVTASGKLACQLPAEGAIQPLPEVHFRDAGRQFLDVWLDNAAGETVDWASTFVEVNRGLAAPVITPAHPEGTPSGDPLEGRLSLDQPPAGAQVRLTLVDRNWREVARRVVPAEGQMTFSFPTTGLDGQIWRLQVDVVDTQGHILARAFRNLTSPRLLSEMSAFHPLAMLNSAATPEWSALRRIVRDLGYIGDRSYGVQSPIHAEAELWDDIQPFPYPTHVNGNVNDFSGGWTTDWEEPAYREQVQRAMRAVATQTRPFGFLGMALTDDCAANTELPLGAYTVIAFHKWLQERYGDYDATCAAWGWTPPEEVAPEDELPYNPYVVAAFHRWLAKKYGGLDQTATAWKLPVQGMGSLWEFGAIQRAMIAGQKAKGNLAPYNDVQEFKRTADLGAELEEPFGRVTGDSVKAAFDKGRTAAWVDAQHFLEESWLGAMTLIQDAAQSVVPTAAVGSDSAYYAHNLPEIFSSLSFLSPYYDDRAVKVNVDRGRMRRPGIFGGNFGAYGGKPANLSGRRSTPWDVLFAGGNALSYFYFGYMGAFTPDWKLSDAHALYQGEVLEEVAAGTGELFAGCERLFAPVAILDSQTSGLCDQLEAKLDPLTTTGRSQEGFQYVCEDLGLNPHTIITPELEKGWLTARKTRVLLLPDATSMSDAEIEAVRRFTEGGGTVIADVLPGRRFPNGNLRPEPPLADLFGVSFDAEGKVRRVRGMLQARTGAADAPQLAFGEALGDPRVKPTEAVALGQVAEAPALLLHAAGQGQACLLNATFASYATFRADGGDSWRAWFETCKRLTTQAGLAPPFACTSQGKPTPGFELSPFSNGASYLLGVQELGCSDFTGARRPVEITLPGPFHVYDVRAGKYLGKLSTLSAELPRSGHRAYALLPYQVEKLELTTDRPTYTGGETINVTADLVLAPAGKRDRHVLRLEAFAPDGKRFVPFRRVVPVPARGPLVFLLTIAVNDAPGPWKLVATDVASGVSATTTLQVKGPAQP